jgi:tetratricopeptide (TPR) repeat protein
METLDATELLHLGLHATQLDDPAKAIEYLKQCLALEPANAKATYLLGALYAQIGIYDRAKSTLARAIDLDANESTAVFQLGLLHVTSGEVTQAEVVWQRLDALPGDHAFNFFRRGLLALVKDEFGECESFLEQGIRANGFNEALNDDMRRLKQSAASAREKLPQAQPVTSSPEAGQTTGRHLLGGYGKHNRH